MKKYLLLFTATILLMNQANGQYDSLINKYKIIKTVIKIAPSGITNKIRICYDRKINDNSSYGIIVSYYHPLSLYQGFKIEPYIRQYLSKVAPEGWYIQENIALGNVFYFTNLGSFTKSENGSAASGPVNLFCAGAGFNTGYQWIMGKKKDFAVDLSFGMQYYYIKPNYTNGHLWYETGPGAVLTPKFSIGYAF